MRLLVSPEARLEYENAVRYYELQLQGLGAAFGDEVRLTLRRLLRWPLAFPRDRGEIRRALLVRFPYKLLYSVERNHVYLIAVAHQHRRPDYWVERMD